MNPNKKWRASNPSAYAAHIIVQVALDSGKIEKKPCEICGAVNVHAHHEDYLKPLEVKWLCPKHHRELHDTRNGKTIGGGTRTKKNPAWPNRKKYQPSPIRDAKIEKAVELRINGLGYKEIAEKLGVSKGTVYKWINPKKYK